MTRLRFAYDIACPFAYLAFRQLHRVRAHAEVELMPVLLGGLLRHVGAPDDPNTAMAPARAAINRRDITLWGALHGVPLRIPPEHPRRTVDAMRVLAAAPVPHREALTAALYAAYWEDGVDVTDREVLAARAAPFGLDAHALIEAGREPLRSATQAAFEAGAFGVPSFLDGPRLLWGQDRIGLLLRDLGDPLPPEGWVGPAVTTSTSTTVTSLRFFHDVSSPFSYLASTQVERIAAAYGHAVLWTPILLGALFRTIGTPDVPLHAMNETRQAYTRRDMHDWAQAWGVPLRFPSHFPLRSVLPLRAMLVEPASTAAIYRAAWGEDRRVDTPEALCAVLTEVGLDGAAIVEQASDPGIKAALRENTERAVASGVCGVPTVEVTWNDGGRVLLWGQDRLVMLRAVLQGWVPPGRDGL
ncbi:MAG: DsbA family protein [Myxococcota bacterium]